jgi:hypothetical protein
MPPCQQAALAQSIPQIKEVKWSLTLPHPELEQLPRFVPWYSRMAENLLLTKHPSNGPMSKFQSQPLVLAIKKWTFGFWSITLHPSMTLKWLLSRLLYNSFSTSWQFPQVELTSECLGFTTKQELTSTLLVLFLTLMPLCKNGGPIAQQLVQAHTVMIILLMLVAPNANNQELPPQQPFKDTRVPPPILSGLEDKWMSLVLWPTFMILPMVDLLVLSLKSSWLSLMVPWILTETKMEVLQDVPSVDVPLTWLPPWMLSETLTTANSHPCHWQPSPWVLEPLEMILIFRFPQNTCWLWLKENLKIHLWPQPSIPHWPTTWRISYCCLVLPPMTLSKTLAFNLAVVSASVVNANLHPLALTTTTVLNKSCNCVVMKSLVQSLLLALSLTNVPMPSAILPSKMEKVLAFEPLSIAVLSPMDVLDTTVTPPLANVPLPTPPHVHLSLARGAHGPHGLDALSLVEMELEPRPELSIKPQPMEEQLVPDLDLKLNHVLPLLVVLNLVYWPRGPHGPRAQPNVELELKPEPEPLKP